jgi:hypothetical protein
MATASRYPDIHTQAGARWLAPFLLVVFATLVAALVMVIHPHFTA